jgi:arabinogalactan endo-1,4-beta-galactosidase
VRVRSIRTTGVIVLLASILVSGVAWASTGTPQAGISRASAGTPRVVSAHNTVRHAADFGGGGQPTVNWALDGTASATNSESGYPASNAIDGDAGTDWCTDSWTGTLTVDLGQVRTLNGLGITLDSSSPSASATIAAGSASGALTDLPSEKNIALDPGNPMYFDVPGGTQARYVALTVWSDTGADVCVGEFRVYGPDQAVAGMDLGADLSFTPQELAAGATFSYQGQQASPVQILREAGGNYVRMRLWVNPPSGYNDLAVDLALARQVEAAGMKIYLDIHYSDFWADPTKQNVPAAWSGQDLTQLTATVESYTKQVISAFAAQGTPVDMVSIGNEIRNGILWPYGEINCPSTVTDCGGWTGLAQLLKAGVTGAEAGNPAGHKLLIMMHYDQGGDEASSAAFYSSLESYGVPFDVIGLSYYSILGDGPLADLKANVDNLATVFHKPIVIAETQYPWTLANGNSPIGDSTGDFAWETSQLNPGYPATPGGQFSFLTDELSIMATAPDGLGAGIFYWAPDWLPGVPWEPGTGIGSPNTNLTLFDFQGAALPGMELYRDPLAVCQSYDPYDTPCVVP